jgi:hypothetical protein
MWNSTQIDFGLLDHFCWWPLLPPLPFKVKVKNQKVVDSVDETTFGGVYYGNQETTTRFGLPVNPKEVLRYIIMHKKHLGDQERFPYTILSIC